MQIKDRKIPLRITCIVIFFVVVCFVYFIRMFNVITNADTSNRIDTDRYYERREPIQAVRGEIYDRNGKLLVCNEYTYDFVFDYDAMAATQTDRNYAILQADYALGATGNNVKRTESSFPFVGTYPNYTYSAEALDTDSNIYYRLLKRIAANEIEESDKISTDKLTAAYLEGFYDANPDEFPTVQEIVEWYISRYSLDATDSNGALFTDEQIDTLLRVRYDMEVADFSIYNRYVMAKDVDVTFITYVEEMNVVGADFTVESSRAYKYPGYASHLLGRTGAIPTGEWEHYQSLGYQMNDVVGLDGCEEAFEEYLRGVDGVKVIVEDKNGNIIDSYTEREAVAGNDVYLTIDIDLQIAAEDALKQSVEALSKQEGGAITATDPDTGEVLVLASYPTYDLSTYTEDYNSLESNRSLPLVNRALRGLYAPGSTFKIGMVAAGVDTHTVDPFSYMYCSGEYTYYASTGFAPNCWIYPGEHGYINAMGALEVSCNCYFYELGRLMGIETMNEYCTAYGLGCYTGIELNEYKGILAGPAYREEHGGRAWWQGDTISAAIGQSDNSYTPMQLSVYVATVLNGGTRYSAHLLREVRSYEGKLVYKYAPEILSQISLSSEAVKTVETGMRQMVEESKTVSAYMAGLPVKVGGKTGTAQLGGNLTDNGLFVCAAPYSNPEIIVTSVIEKAGGGTYASKAAAAVLDAYYNK
ncbi:MAG: hypothetical protein IJ345_03880 [Clostridia bacterium]|nr:hypothetical protein [Clostridia bacterium]